MRSHDQQQAIDITANDLSPCPYRFYDRLRQTSAAVKVIESGQTQWAISRYRNVAEGLRDLRFVRETAKPSDDDSLYQRLNNTHSMLNRDPPTQSRLRKASMAPFLSNAVSALESKFDTLVQQHLDQIDKMRTFDVLEDLANPLATAAISKLLGFSDRVLLPVIHGNQNPRPIVNLCAILTMAIANKRAGLSTSDDFLGTLLKARQTGHFHSDEEIVGSFLIILRAGQHTTAKLMANGLALLLQYPNQLARLQQNPSLVESAIEEMLRFESPVQSTYRHASKEILLDGEKIPQGAIVWFLLGSANRDPDQFESPDDFNIARIKNRHLGMGGGQHLCIGAPVARLLAKLLFRSLLDRFEKISIASGSQPRWTQDLVFRHIENLRVRVS